MTTEAVAFREGARRSKPVARPRRLAVQQGYVDRAPV